MSLVYLSILSIVVGGGWDSEDKTAKKSQHPGIRYNTFTGDEKLGTWRSKAKQDAYFLF